MMMLPKAFARMVLLSGIAIVCRGSYYPGMLVQLNGFTIRDPLHPDSKLLKDPVGIIRKVEKFKHKAGEVYHVKLTGGTEPQVTVNFDAIDPVKPIGKSVKLKLDTLIIENRCRPRRNRPGWGPCPVTTRSRKKHLKELEDLNGEIGTVKGKDGDSWVIKLSRKDGGKVVINRKCLIWMPPSMITPGALVKIMDTVSIEGLRGATGIVERQDASGLWIVVLDKPFTKPDGTQTSRVAVEHIHLKPPSPPQAPRKSAPAAARRGPQSLQRSVAVQDQELQYPGPGRALGPRPYKHPPAYQRIASSPKNGNVQSPKRKHSAGSLRHPVGSPFSRKHSVRSPRHPVGSPRHSVGSPLSRKHSVRSPRHPASQRAFGGAKAPIGHPLAPKMPMDFVANPKAPLPPPNPLELELERQRKRKMLTSIKGFEKRSLRTKKKAQRKTGKVHVNSEKPRQNKVPNLFNAIKKRGELLRPQSSSTVHVPVASNYQSDDEAMTGKQPRKESSQNTSNPNTIRSTSKPKPKNPDLFRDIRALRSRPKRDVNKIVEQRQKEKERRLKEEKEKIDPMEYMNMQSSSTVYSESHWDEEED